MIGAQHATEQEQKAQKAFFNRCFPLCLYNICRLVKHGRKRRDPGSKETDEVVVAQTLPAGLSKHSH